MKGKEEIENQVGGGINTSRWRYQAVPDITLQILGTEAWEGRLLCETVNENIHDLVAPQLLLFTTHFKAFLV